MASSFFNQNDNSNESRKDVTLNSFNDKRTVTVLSAGMTINGNIESDCDIVVEGTIIGDVKCRDLSIQQSGNVFGNVVAENLTLNKSLKGNVTCKEKFVLNADTQVDGDIVANDVVCDGRIVGTVKCHNSLQLKSKGEIKGNCSSASFLIEDGAVINGKLSTKRRNSSND